MITLSHARKLITKALRKAESDALDEGVDVTTQEFKDALKLVQSRLLEEMSIPEEDYGAFIESLKDIGRAKKLAAEEKMLEKITPKLEEFKVEVIGLIPEIPEVIIPPPDYNDLLNKPPQLTAEMVEEMIQVAIKGVRQESFIKVTRPTVIQKEEYDDRRLQRHLDTLEEKISEIKIPPPVDIESVKEELLEEFENRFADNFKKNIKIFDMPDWRKLAMGLQGQIDTLSTFNATGNPEIPTGTVNGVNTSFTVLHTPKAVIIDGMYRVSGFGYTYSGGIITVDADNPPVFFIRSIF